MRSFGYFERMTAEEFTASLAGVELAVQKDPSNADAWAILALLRVHGFGMGFKDEISFLTSGLMAARRAIDAAPSNHLASSGLAQALFFQKEFSSFRNAAERTITLNPMDSSSLAVMGEMLAYAGDWDRGLALSVRAKQLNPHHPPWYWHMEFNNSYRQADYRGALDHALKMNVTNNWAAHALMAAAYGQLGDIEAGRKSLREMLRLNSDAAEAFQKTAAKWFDPEHLRHLVEGMRKAGLEVVGGEEQSEPAAVNASVEMRSDEGFWVAVLPFKSSGTSLELTSLAEGLSEEIVTGLSRFSYLRVIARSSTLRYANEKSDVRTIGKQLGARYVMEGSLRQAGSTLRVGVQLVDATSGAHLWAESYDRPFKPDEIFALQDDLVPRIVSTIADNYGVLPHSMSETLRGKDPKELTPYEAVLRSFGYYERISPEAHAETRDILEQALEKAPQHPDCLAWISSIYADEHKFGFNPQPDPLGRALAAARRAIEFAPSNAWAHTCLAQALFFRRELEAFRIAAEHAIALNPFDAVATAFLGLLMAYAGDWEHGCKLTERGRHQNPHHPGWYWFGDFYHAYLKGEYRAALNVALKVNMPGHFHQQIVLVAAYSHLGEREAAQRALQDLLALRPDFALIAREELGKWFLPDLVEHLIDGLRQAGLEIAGP